MTFQLSFCQRSLEKIAIAWFFPVLLYAVIAKAQIPFLSTIPGGWLLAFALQCQKDLISWVFGELSWFTKTIQKSEAIGNKALDQASIRLPHFPAPWQSTLRDSRTENVWKAGREISGDAERRHVLPLTGSSTYCHFGCYSTSALQPLFLACEDIPRPMKSFGVWGRSSVMAQNADFLYFVSFGRNRRLQPLRSYLFSSSRDETFHGVTKCKRTDDWSKQWNSCQADQHPRAGRKAQKVTSSGTICAHYVA